MKKGRGKGRTLEASSKRGKSGCWYVCNTPDVCVCVYVYVRVCVCVCVSRLRLNREKCEISLSLFFSISSSPFDNIHPRLPLTTAITHSPLPRSLFLPLALSPHSRPLTSLSLSPLLPPPQSRSRRAHVDDRLAAQRDAGGDLPRIVLPRGLQRPEHLHQGPPPQQWPASGCCRADCLGRALECLPAALIPSLLCRSTPTTAAYRGRSTEWRKRGQSLPCGGKAASSTAALRGASAMAETPVGLSHPHKRPRARFSPVLHYDTERERLWLFYTRSTINENRTTDSCGVRCTACVARGTDSSSLAFLRVPLASPPPPFSFTARAAIQSC